MFRGEICSVVLRELLDVRGEPLNTELRAGPQEESDEFLENHRCLEPRKPSQGRQETHECAARGEHNLGVFPCLCRMTGSKSVCC